MVFDVSLLLGVVFDSDILATNFSCVFKNIYERKINESALLGLSPLLRKGFEVLLLLGIGFDSNILDITVKGSFRIGCSCYKFFMCFKKYIWTERQWKCIISRITIASGGYRYFITVRRDFGPDLLVTNFQCYFKAHTWDRDSKKNFACKLCSFLIFSQFSHF